VIKDKRMDLDDLQSANMQQQQIEWRRAKVMEMLSKGESNQSEIATILQVDRSNMQRPVILKTTIQK
jgi:DNA-binding MarR family transcriptional regulator